MLKKCVLYLILCGTVMNLNAKEVINFDKLKRLEGGKSIELPFKQKDADTRQIRLVLETRFDWTGLGGYTYGLEVMVNGHKVPGARLLNKPLNYKIRNGGGNKWANVDSSSYMVMYSNDFSDKIKTLKSYVYGLYEKEQEPYRFVFDLTGLTRHVGENKVILKAKSLPLIFRNVAIEFDNNFMPRINDPKSMVSPAPLGKIGNFQLRPQLKVKPEIYASSNGAVTIKAGKVNLPLTSSFSLPNGKFLKIEAIPGAKKVKLPFEKSWTTKEYKITRKIELGAGHIKVSDTFTNLRKELGGVIFKNTINLPEKADKVLFGGVEVMLNELRKVTNPSIGAQFGKDFAALLIEDDILRNQGYFSRDSKSISLGDRNLALPPKGSQTVSWSIYIVPDGGYYDFINKVRKNWGSNFTCNGPFSFPYGNGCDFAPFTPWVKKTITKRTVDDFLKRNPVNYIITHVAGNYSVKDSRATPRLGHGTAIPEFTWWCNMTRNMTAAFKKYAPNVKVFGYIHKNLCSELGNREKYPESIARDSVSKHLSKVGISARYVPTLENSYGKKLAETYRYLVENVGTNIYMDEICLGVTAWEEYPQWDNCTVIINPQNHKVVKKVSIPNLLVKPWLEEMIKYLKSKGCILIANGAPATRTLQNHHIMQFVEKCMGLSGLYSAHLTSPIAFCYSSGAKGYEHLQETLEAGLVCFKYGGDWSNRLFPLTPLELRPGYIIAEERIVTKKSGFFGWNKNCKAEVFVYDGKGNLSNKNYVKHLEKSGKTVFEVRMPSDHIAIIVKK